MRMLSLLPLFLLLAACAGGASRPVDLALRDLGEPAAILPAGAIALARIEVRTAAWLAGPAQHYRLSYADPLRRHSYAESRWAAPPGELLERWLQRSLPAGQATGDACRLVLELDELEQRFDGPRSSQVVLEARVSLQPLRGDTVHAQQAFHIVKPAGSPDARGGVQATRAGADALAQELVRWLAELARDRPQTIVMCKEKS